MLPEEVVSGLKCAFYFAVCFQLINLHPFDLFVSGWSLSFFYVNVVDSGHFYFPLLPVGRRWQLPLHQ